MLDWGKYFDRIFCVFFLPNKERLERIRKELDRVGILTSSNFEWRFTVPSKLDNIIHASFENKKWMESIGAVNGAIEQTKILKESLLLGYERILILEDDVAFLKDLNAIQKILDDIPDGYDIIQCDKGIGRKQIGEWADVCRHSINGSFADCTGHHFGLSDANIYTRAGMAEAIRILDAKPIAVDQIDRFGNFRRAVATESLCIQVFFQKSNYSSSPQIHDIYTRLNIDYGKYELPKGYGKGKFYAPPAPATFSFDKENQPKTPGNTIAGWDQFDYIGVVCYTGYRDREEKLVKELKRVGLINNVHFHWDTPSVFRDILFKASSKKGLANDQGCFCMLVKHYEVVKTAYDLGCKSVLVMEDDIRFMRNLGEIGSMLSRIPLDYDHIMLDRNVQDPGEQERYVEFAHKNQKGTWGRFRKTGSTGCYAFSRRGMRRYIQIIEEAAVKGSFRNPDYYFWDERDGKVFWDSTYNRYFSYPHIAVQTISGRNGSFTDLGEYYWNFLSKVGILQKDYNMDCPIVTKDNFFELLEYAIDNQPARRAGGIGFCNDNAELIMSYDKQCSNKMTKGVRYDYSCMWGLFNNKKNRDSLQIALRDKARLVMCELGAIFCFDPKKPHSFVSDDKGIIFDATHVNRLEQMLGDKNLRITPEQIEKARRLINKITINKITTYNRQPLVRLSIGSRMRRKVLVVDQKINSPIDRYGMVSKETFARMLATAIRDNPEADILIKSHPDTGTGSEGYYQAVKTGGNIYKIDYPINPYSLFDICDKVYVGFSNMGFEALLAGKEVYTFGMPFYAGWGLTRDYQRLERRNNNRTLEELFYIYCCLYTHWVDPDAGKETTIDAVIDKMIAMRDHKTQVMTDIKKKSVLEHKPWISNFKPKDEGKPRVHSSIIIPSRYSMMRKHGRLA